MTMIVETVSTSKPGINLCDLPVTLTGVQLTVAAGTFVIGSVVYELSEDKEYSLESPAEDMWIAGYLVEKRADGEISLMIEEVTKANPGTAYRFHGTSEYRLLFTKIIALVPSGVSDWTDANVHLFKIVASD